MDRKMLYVCSICTKSEPPLIMMNEEPKNILAAVTSVTQIKEMMLLMCRECSSLVDSVIQFKKIALKGVQNILRLLYVAESTAKVRLAETNPKKFSIYKKVQVRRQPLYLVQSNETNKKSVVLKLSQNTKLTSGADHQGPKTKYHLSTTTGTGPVQIQPESEAHSETCTPTLQLNENIHIKEEPELETQYEIELEPDIKEIQPVSDYSESAINSDTTPNIVISNVQSLAGTPYDGANDGVASCGTVEVKSEPSDESTDTCESDYGNEEDIILAALVKTKVPTLAYLKATAPESIISTEKTVQPSTSKRRRKKKKITVRKKHK